MPTADKPDHVAVLSLLVLKLAYRLKHTPTNPDRQAVNARLAEQASAYIRHHRLSSPLRDEAITEDHQ